MPETDDDTNDSGARIALPTLPLVTDEMLLNCMQCGFCLPHCPTYSLTELERYSPRGRIQLTRALFEGQLLPSESIADIAEAINTCLGCLACQTACPAGVEYEKIFESAKTLVLKTQMKRPMLEVRLLALAMKWLFPYPTRFKRISRLIALTQRWPVEKLLPKNLRRLYRLAPTFSLQFFDESYRNPEPAKGERVLFLSGCIMNTAFADVHWDTVALLQSVGLSVIVPKSQVCCGALNAHNGFLEEAKAMARANLHAFAGEELIVVNSAGCGAMMKHYAQLFSPDEPEYAKATALARRVRDMSEVLLARNFEPKQVRASITYQDACHLEHGQKIRREPRELLQRKFGRIVELNSPQCCGSAGIYNLLQPKLSEQLLEEKLRAIARTGAEIVVTANPGCLLQLQYGLRQISSKVRAMHLASALRL
ncbi:MAG: heterodisulfide reductase-related iron-sulfur binding cluster [Chloroherpetonaceae bacterium]|nr:heterodisulfide reductase-related iron-sulfur binding cluster [Chloroherpetonaceae bacterium]MCS7210829.1 heterodisulfide reductase-related iron-sulfur binding cluster [Chloroherpetonaceae bacterium]MDW8020496.1 heterodisulfide reductase-related iron-sulfur binding cluster [Chloroherpetonaceae bacterium]MDW8465368.1 heterodisulfide reductase-related iron-sulfur binding cluster [Chloroherpetonaceae bacterium]